VERQRTAGPAEIEQRTELRQRPFLQWRGLHVDMPVLRLFCAFWVSIVIALGCVVIILAPTNNTATQAAIAILSSLATGWISWMVRSPGNGDTNA
jgi:hypothetical protein